MFIPESYGIHKYISPWPEIKQTFLIYLNLYAYNISIYIYTPLRVPAIQIWFNFDDRNTCAVKRWMVYSDWRISIHFYSDLPSGND